MKAYDHDLAISAVSYDSLLVHELIARLQPRLGQSAVWAGQQADAPVAAAPDVPTDAPAAPDATFPTLGSGARVALVMLHPLWAREPQTATDSGVLRQRMKRQPKSVVVLVLDDASVPDWLESAARHNYATEGLEPLIETVLTLIAESGGQVHPRDAAVSAPDGYRPLFDPPTPFMGQPRAHMALKRELESMAEELRARVTGPDGDQAMDVLSLPNRFIARHDSVAVSFSWLAGRGGTIAEGRLMVISWNDVPRDAKGLSALKSASRQREVVYAAEGTNADSWRWRVDAPHGRACSTEHLVGEWLDVALR